MDTKSALIYGLGAALATVGGETLALSINLIMSDRTPVHSLGAFATAIVLCVVGVALVRSRLQLQRATS